MSSMAGNPCVYCGSWIAPGTGTHWCPQMNPNQPDVHHHHHHGTDPTPELRRIADALERIADALDGDCGEDCA